MYRLRDPHLFSHACTHTHDDEVTTDKTMTRERATSGHMRQPPRDKTKDKTKGARNPDKPKTKSRKKTITDFLLLFFSPRFRVLLIHFERKKIFFFQTLFCFRSIINQAANVTISPKTNRATEIRLNTSGRGHKKNWGREEKERSRIGCKFDVNEPKLRSRRVGAQSIQGGRRIRLMPTCQPRMQTGDVSSEKHTATSRQDQPTNRKVARTPKLEH